METLIREMRAMLLQFKHSPLKDLYFRRGDWAVFLARPGGGANPMLATEDTAPTVAAAPAPRVLLSAPHLGLFEPACAAGDTVAAGALLGTIDVLGRRTDVLAQVSGRIAQVLVPANDLVEYGATLIEMETAA